MTDITSTIKQITLALTPVADKLSIGASHIYLLFIKQQFIIGIRDILYVIFTTFFIIFCFKRFNKEKSSEFGDWGLLKATYFILILISLLFNLILMFNIPTHLFNPEYGALNDIILTVRGN